jgi:hypothetical protein
MRGRIVPRCDILVKFDSNLRESRNAFETIAAQFPAIRNGIHIFFVPST